MDDWQLHLDRMRLNAALLTLSEGYDSQAARDVIESFHGIPGDTRHRNEWWARRRSQRLNHGITPENETVAVSDERVVVDHIGGPGYFLRVGQFKVFRIIRPATATIVFRPFWASDAATSIEPTTEWHLHYRLSDLIPAALIRVDWQRYDPSLWEIAQSALSVLLSGHWAWARTKFWAPAETVLYMAEGYRVGD